MMKCHRDLFSLPADVVYLNHAYMSPMSVKVQQAGRDAIERLGNPSYLTAQHFFEPADALRRSFATLIGTTEWESVAIIPSVSYGIGIIASNLDLRSDQNVVVLGEQFPSNVYPWRRICRESGATLRTVTPPASGLRRGHLWNQSLLDAIDANTKMVSIANVHWSDGTLFDLEAVGEQCRVHGSTFVVDGTQSVGALPLDVSALGLDALICAGYKSLTGPYGLGLAYFGPRFHDAKPIEDNWIARAGSEIFSRLVEYVDEYQPGAKRFDIGEYSSFTLQPMLAAAIEQVEEWTPGAVQSYCRVLTDRLSDGAAAIGYHVEEPAYRAGHLMGLRMPTGIDTETVKSGLQDRKISVSIRGQALRVAPHIYSCEADIEALLEVLAESIKS